MPMIEGVEIKQLKMNADERGALTELLRVDDPIFEKFSQVYCTLNYPGIVRGWHYHKKQLDVWAVVKGMVKTVLYDMREISPTYGVVNEFFQGEQNHIVVKIPVGVLHGYKTVGTEPSLLLNFPTELYDRSDPDEFRIAWDSPDIPYSWDIKIT